MEGVEADGVVVGRHLDWELGFVVSGWINEESLKLVLALEAEFVVLILD